MGVILSKLIDLLTNISEMPANILMLGLDGAGKTTILYKLKLGTIVTTIPTIGYNVETVDPCEGLQLTVWDVGGQKLLRPLWQNHCCDIDGVIFVIDSCDNIRFHTAREELLKVLSYERMERIPVLILANKQDLRHAVKAKVLKEILQLRTVGNRIHIHPCSAVSGAGLLKGITQFCKMVKKFKIYGS